MGNKRADDRTKRGAEDIIKNDRPPDTSYILSTSLDPRLRNKKSRATI